PTPVDRAKTHTTPPGRVSAQDRDETGPASTHNTHPPKRPRASKIQVRRTNDKPHRTGQEQGRHDLPHRRPAVWQVRPRPLPHDPARVHTPLRRAAPTPTDRKGQPWPPHRTRPPSGRPRNWTWRPTWTGSATTAHANPPWKH